MEFVKDGVEDHPEENEITHNPISLIFALNISGFIGHFVFDPCNKINSKHYPKCKP